MKTAWFLTHRIREVMAPAKDAGPLGGEGKILEADEAFIGARAGRKLGRPVVEKQAVFALVERERPRALPSCSGRSRQYPPLRNGKERFQEVAAYD